MRAGADDHLVRPAGSRFASGTATARVGSALAKAEADDPGSPGPAAKGSAHVITAHRSAPRGRPVHPDGGSGPGPRNGGDRQPLAHRRPRRFVRRTAMKIIDKLNEK